MRKSKIPLLSQSMVDSIVRPVHIQRREEDSRPHDQSRDPASTCHIQSTFLPQWLFASQSPSLVLS